MKKGICLITVFCLLLALSACSAKSDTESSNGVITSEISLPKPDSNLPEGILYQASQDHENEAYRWSIHELLLTPDADMESILADYAKKYEQYVHYYQESYAHDEESLKAIRPEWLDVVGENENEGCISAVDLEWPGWWIPREEVLGIIEPYRGQYRAIPVFAYDFSEIIDYFIIGIG